MVAAFHDTSVGRMVSEAAPRFIGPYRVIEVLGEGGMGVVYKAEHKETHAEVALKTLRVPHESHFAGLRREIHALMRIRHPGVVRLFAEGAEGNIPYYVMELLEGSTFADHLRVTWFSSPRAYDQNAPTVIAEDSMIGGPTVVAQSSDPKLAVGSGPSTLDSSASGRVSVRSPPTSANPPSGPRKAAGGGRLITSLSLMRGLCETLDYLHGEGIVHRDLKPSNVFIRADDTPVLMDFGLVWRFPAAVGREVLEVSRALAGTPAYMSPEQIRGELVDARTDLYAVGCMLYEATTGRVPFAETPLMLHARLTSRPTPPSEIVDEVPKALEDLVMRLLATRPRDRIGHASDVARALASLGADPPRIPTVTSRAYVYRPELTGREEALARLEEHLIKLRLGKGGVLLVGGESGIGKTVLSMAFARLAAARGVHVVAGSCLAEGASAGAPLHPFRPFFENIADLCMERGAGFTASILGEDVRVLDPYEPRLARVPGHDDHPEPAELPAQAARERLFRTIAGALAGLARERDVLLLLDDLQWADELSLDLLAWLSDEYFESTRLLVLGTFRSDEVGPELSRLFDRTITSRLDLGRLDEAGVGAIIADMLALDAPPAVFASFLSSLCAGNPFFVAEYVRAAVDAGLIVRDASGRFTIVAGRDAAPASADRGPGAYKSLPLPSSLRALVSHRLASLSPSARSLADVASVIGREMDADLLASVAQATWVEGAPPSDPGKQSGSSPGVERRDDAAVRSIDFAVSSAARELVARQVLEEIEGGKLRFLHDKLREISYDALPEERRRALHLTVALAIEEAPSKGPRWETVTKLAHHYTRAGDSERAIAHLSEAAELAIKNFANRETAALVRELIALEDASGEHDATRTLHARTTRARWERRLADAYYALGDMDATVRHATRAIELAGLSPPRSARGWAGRLLAGVPVQIAHRLAPETFVADADRRALYREAALAMQRLSQRFYFSDAIAMIAGSLSAANLAEKAGGGVVAATPYAMLGMALGIGRLGGLARRYFSLAQSAAEKMGDDEGMIVSLYAEATCKSGEGDWAAASELLARAREIGVRTGNRAETETVETVIANADYFTGRFTESKDAFFSILRSARAGDSRQHVAWGLYGAARAMIPLGEIDEAIALLREARAELEREDDLPSKIICLGLLATAHLARGDHDAALEAARATSAHVRENRLMAYAIVSGYAGAADVYLARWERGGTLAAQRDAERAVRDLKTIALVLPIAAPYAQRYEGTLAFTRGDRTTARASWDRALASAQRLTMPFDEALAHADLAKLAERGSLTRRVHLTRARTLFSMMRCARHEAEIEAIMRRSS